MDVESAQSLVVFLAGTRIKGKLDVARRCETGQVFYEHPAERFEVQLLGEAHVGKAEALE